MGVTTGIQWTDATWNPVRGCSRVSEGCRNCYAERQAARFRGPGKPFEGFVHTVNGYPAWTGKVALMEKHLEDPMHWTTPRRIFVNSMSDLFHEALSDRDILRVMRVMDRAPQHTYQVLTKRPKRMRDFMREHLHGKPPRYLWLGVSVEDQATGDERVPLLVQTPAALRFVSYEPALGPVDFGGDLAALDWLIIGGESGPGARPFEIRWAERAIKDCHSCGVACFVKQLGASVMARDSKGGNPEEWPEHLRVRERSEVRMNEQAAKVLGEGKVIYDYVCEGCGAVGELGVSTDIHAPFGCPEGCGATYIQWQWQHDGVFKLTSVVCPVFTEGPTLEASDGE